MAYTSNISVSEMKDDYKEIVRLAQQTGMTPENMMLYLTLKQITNLNAQIYELLWD